MIRDTKNCPDCAEAVREEAAICRHCGHRFSPTPSPQQLRDRDGAEWRSRVFVGTLVVIAIISMITQYG